MPGPRPFNSQGRVLRHKKKKTNQSKGEQYLKGKGGKEEALIACLVGRKSAPYVPSHKSLLKWVGGRGRGYASDRR